MDKDARWTKGPRYLHVVVSERTAEFVVVHAGLVLADPPQPGHLLRLQQLELPVVGGPGDDVLVPGLLEELEEELPQGDSTVHSSELKRDRRWAIKSTFPHISVAWVKRRDIIPQGSRSQNY